MDTHFSDDVAEHIWSRARIGLAFVAPDHQWLRVNPYFCEMLGYSEAELKERTWQSVTYHDDVKPDRTMAERVANKDLDFYSMSKRYVPKVGPPVWIRLHVTRVNLGESGWMFLAQAAPCDLATVNHIVAGRSRPADVNDLARFIGKAWKPMVFVAGVAALAIAKGCALW